VRAECGGVALREQVSATGGTVSGNQWRTAKDRPPHIPWVATLDDRQLGVAVSRIFSARHWVCVVESSSASEKKWEKVPFNLIFGSTIATGNESRAHDLWSP